MKKLLVGILIGLSIGTLCAESPLTRIKEKFADDLNAVLKMTYEQGFFDGYRAAEKAVRDAENLWNKTHS